MLNQNLLLTGGDDAYLIQRSLRFRSSASASLSRTPGGAGNRKTWTYSTWAKRGILGSGSQELIRCFINTNDTATFIFYQDTLYFTNSTGGAETAKLYTAQVFRDPSAWYHLVLTIDTTQATASNRLKMYINGSQVTAFNSTTYPSQNTDLSFNSANIHRIGQGDYPGYPQNFDGYMTDIHFIDGQQLTPSSFGETDAITGVWKPKRYAGTYGTNGFKLDFSDNSAATAAAIGKDSSGNGNNWTPNNISLSAGATYDSMLDVPTLTSESASNFATLNPLYISSGTTGSVFNGNLSTTGGGNPTKIWPSTISVKNGGKYYAEFTPTGSGNYCEFAVGEIKYVPFSGGAMKGSGVITYDVNTFGGGYYINSTSSVSNSRTLNTNDVIMVAFDSTTRNVWFGINGTWNDSGNPATAANPIGAVSGTDELAFFVRAESTTVAANFGQRPFAYTPPTGFKALNTYNLPDSTILAGNKHFDVTIYTGNNSTQSIVNSGGFQPDLVWLKHRNPPSAAFNLLYDSIRGVGKWLSSNATNAEGNIAQSLTAFNNNGFSVGADPDGSSNTGWNPSGGAMVAWQWKGGGSAVSNTSGSITSQVSANPSAGFSVVTWTAQSSGTATIGHGLGVTPQFIITKSRTAAGSDWVCYTSTTGASQYVLLNSTGASVTNVNVWNNTAPTSSVFSTGSGYAGYGSMLAHCFAEVAGYSKFGSFAANGSSDNVFVYTGFRPKFLLIKTYAESGDWQLWDSARGSYNVNGADLYPNSSAAEATVNAFDFLSNGFKMRVAASPAYIYAAFAENPFKNSLAR